MTVEEEIASLVGRLSESQRFQLLRYARSIRSTHPFTPGHTVAQMMKNIETISAETARELEQIIDEGCERIDEDGW